MSGIAHGVLPRFPSTMKHSSSIDTAVADALCFDGTKNVPVVESRTYYEYVPADVLQTTVLHLCCTSKM